MTDMLRGVAAKIVRAEELLGELNDEAKRFIEATPPPYTISTELQENDTQYVFYADVRQHFPDRFSVLAGEIVQHLASSLDHLFAALVVQNGKTVTRSHYFPICISEDRFNKARKSLQDVSFGAREIIESVQPFRTTTPEDTILAAIKDLNNTDKHRLLLALYPAGNLGGNVVIGKAGEEMRDINGALPSIIGLGNPEVVRLEHGRTEFFRISLATSTPNFYAEASFETKVAFARCGLVELVPVAQILPALIAGVRHTIGLFSGEFDNPVPR